MLYIKTNEFQRRDALLGPMSSAVRAQSRQQWLKSSPGQANVASSAATLSVKGRAQSRQHWLKRSPDQANVASSATTLSMKGRAQSRQHWLKSSTDQANVASSAATLSVKGRAPVSLYIAVLEAPLPGLLWTNMAARFRGALQSI